jgi:hypothetical protein
MTLKKHLNYSERIALALPHYMKPTKKGEMGKMYFPEIQHDTWCKALKNEDCNCKPDIFIETDDGRLEVLMDGSVRKVGI